jgi:hypothetical protein
MICKNCGHENSDYIKFCTNCGHDLSDAANSGFSESPQSTSVGNGYYNQQVSADGLDEELVRAYIGKKADVMCPKVMSSGFNVNGWAIVFGLNYFLYRKMYLYVLIAAGVSLVLNLLPFGLSSLSGLVFLGMSITFYPFYKNQIKKAIEKVETKFPELSREQKKAVLSVRGGTMPGMVFFGLSISLCLFAVLLLVSGQPEVIKMMLEEMQRETPAGFVEFFSALCGALVGVFGGLALILSVIGLIMSFIKEGNDKKYLAERYVDVSGATNNLPSILCNMLMIILSVLLTFVGAQGSKNLSQLMQEAEQMKETQQEVVEKVENTPVPDVIVEEKEETPVETEKTETDNSSVVSASTDGKHTLEFYDDVTLTIDDKPGFEYGDYTNLITASNKEASFTINNSFVEVNDTEGIRNWEKNYSDNSNGYYDVVDVSTMTGKDGKTIYYIYRHMKDTTITEARFLQDIGEKYYIMTDVVSNVGNPTVEELADEYIPYIG